jgi:hypothetical protein
LRQGFAGLRAPRRSGFAGLLGLSDHHINGAFAGEMMVPWLRASRLGFGFT